MTRTHFTYATRKSALALAQCRALVALLSQLQRGREVLVRGLLQSRDIHRPDSGERRVVIEVAALEIILLPTTRTDVLTTNPEARKPHERSSQAAP